MKVKKFLNYNFHVIIQESSLLSYKKIEMTIHTVIGYVLLIIKNGVTFLTVAISDTTYSLLPF